MRQDLVKACNPIMILYIVPALEDISLFSFSIKKNKLVLIAAGVEDKRPIVK